MARMALRTAALLAAGCLLGACSTAGSSRPAGDRRVIQVAAAENFWGSIAAQVGGGHVHVVSIITNPNTDPHSYEPTAVDARIFAGAGLVIENGIGYDPWAARLLAADQGQQTVLNVGAALGVPDGGNPHRWYNPADVRAVIRLLAADYGKLDPADKRLLRPAPGPVHLRWPAEVLLADRRDQGQVRRHAGRRLGVDLRDAGARARPEAR